MNVVAYAVELKDGWVPQIRYAGYQVDALRRDSWAGGEVIWEWRLGTYETAEEAVKHAQDRIDTIIKGLFG